MLKPAPDWQFAVAYVLVALPIIYTSMMGHYMDREQKVWFSIVMGLGIGGALFIVRRQRPAQWAWAALIFYGILVLLTVVSAVVNSLPIE